MMTSFFLPVFKTRVVPLHPTKMANEVLLFSILMNSQIQTHLTVSPLHLRCWRSPPPLAAKAL